MATAYMLFVVVAGVVVAVVVVVMGAVGVSMAVELVGRGGEDWMVSAAGVDNGSLSGMAFVGSMSWASSGGGVWRQECGGEGGGVLGAGMIALMTLSATLKVPLRVLLVATTTT